MTKETVEYIISNTSRDRVGIVYEISSAIAELNGNIMDSKQTMMGGYYNMILRASFSRNLSRQDIERKLAEVDAKSPFPLNILVFPVSESEMDASKPENRYALTASAPDRVGLVAKMAGFCVAQHINILDLSTTLAEGEFVMVLEVDLSRCISISEVRQALAEFGQQQNLRVVLQHYDIFKAVNEISLPIRPPREK